ncbi:MAG: hypothetical protein MUF49_04430 [Oculatellaceae cyanobacterium Prado106]|nr:hypothetical protein [Oculatellaceae cyanobacterium Prado106]
MKDRFHLLLKRRLRSEIERNPPLFPWETEGYDYDSEALPAVVAPRVPSQPWADQLRALSLPVPMPETVLAQIFAQCQAVVQTSLQEGAKLVRAVESLFPGHDVALNQLAGLVLASPVRSGTSAPARPLSANLSANFPSHYEQATPAQQMALSLIAAREVIESLTIRLSPHSPQAERRWITASGNLLLNVTWDAAHQQIRVQGQLPCEGSMVFQHEGMRSQTHRLDAGQLSVELFNVELNQSYLLEVQFEGADQAALVFAIALAD